MIAWAVEALLASAVLIALVLAARLPVRRAFGPGVAYALWALPALRLLLPPLPSGWVRESAAPLAAVSGHFASLVLPETVPDAAPSVLGAALIALWCAGSLLFLAFQLLAYIRFTRLVVRTSAKIGKIGRIALVASDAVPDPLAFGVAYPTVAVPRDFRARYGRRERTFVLAHEVAHHRRGDVAANWAALVVLALHWFNPLAWIAFRAFRADQEMANDAHVLAGCDANGRHAYACALVKAAGGRVPAAACGLHTINDLKGRLRMLATPTSRRRRVTGAVVIAGATLGLLGFTASGSEAADTVRAGVEQATGVPLAALDAAALFQAPPPDAGPDAPPAPPGPTSPGSGGRHVETVREGGATHVTVIENGRTQHFEGAAAEAWVAAHPVPEPPAPPAPPVPPVPGVPPVPPVPPAPPTPPHAGKIVIREHRIAPGERDAAFAALRDMPEVRSQNCTGTGSDRSMVMDEQRDGRRRIVICTNRIAAAAEQARAAAGAAEVARAEADVTQRQAIRAALEGLRVGRAAVAADRRLSETRRRQATEAIDRSIRRLEAQADGAS